MVCQHVDSLKNNRNLGVIAAGIRKRRFAFSIQSCGMQTVLKCSVCSKSTGRLIACLECGVVCCTQKGHMSQHAQRHSGDNHTLGVDVQRGEVWCSACKDYVYSRPLDRAIAGLQASSPASGAPACLHSARPRQRSASSAGEGGKVWTPSPAEVADIRTKGDAVPVSLEAGLRALNNLGNTCFMSSVLQALLRLPPLQDYFLSERHPATGSNHCHRNHSPAHPCLGCEMRVVFEEVFRGSATPYSPCSFLLSWWRHSAASQAEHLAGYEQQDAHEFYLSAISAVHSADSAQPAPLTPRNSNPASRLLAGNVLTPGIQPQTPGSNPEEVSDCQCIVHRIFTGTLRSDLVCSDCGLTSTALDPCVDIGLDIHPLNSTWADNTANQMGDKGGVAGGRGGSGRSNVDSGGGRGGGGGVSLLNCLARFTTSEKLQQQIECQRCMTKRDCVKQMSIQRLPPVLCFHIKRFEHSSSKQTSRKISRWVSFPLHRLDMSPFVSPHILSSRFKHNLAQAGTEDGPKHVQDSMNYELIAVVSHTGQLDGGHYVSYVRVENNWYKCDDAWITRVHESTVRACEAYLLFYASKPLCTPA